MAEDLITSTGTTVTHDETAGLQNSVVTPLVPGDADDDDVAVSTLPSEFSDRLTTLGFDPNGAIGAAESDGNVIQINGTGISDLALVDANGDPLDGDSSGLFTTDGQEVFLFTDSADNNIVLGKTALGDIVFAIYLEETGTPVSGAKLWTVQYESLSHNDPTNPDDPDRLDLTDKVFVTADQALVFNFDLLASGANLFGAVGTTSTALVVIGEDITLDANGKYIPNQTDDIKSSQGGDGATIGIDSQMFDPGEGAYFTYVTNTSVLGGGDNANSIQYGGTQEVTGAAFRISQTQGNALATAQISAYDLEDAPQGVDFIDARGSGAPVSITAVRVFNAAGVLIEEETAGLAPSVDDPTVDIVFSDGPDGARIATVSGLDDLYTIAWDTDGVHDQVLIKGIAGKFDIGRFALTQAESDTDEVGSKVIFEDDGPVNNAATVNVNVDEDELTGLSTGITDNDATTTVAAFTGAQIAGLVDAGADEPVKVSLNPAIEGADTGLDSKGFNILFDYVDATHVNGVADGRTVFTLVQTAGADTVLGTDDDAFTFTLLDQIDHTPLATGGGDGETIALSLASVFVATDFDNAGTTGDSVVIDAGASVTIENDVPVNNAAVVNVNVDEDELTGLSTGITDNDATTTVAAFTGAQIAGLVDSGADESVNVSLNPAIDGVDTGLDSKGSNILFDYVDATHVDGVTADARTVFTLVQTAGADTVLGTDDDAFTFTLLDQIDHTPLAMGGGDEETIALSLASVFVATDFDGDSVVIDAGASVTIENDVPTIGPISDGLVDFAAGSTVTKTLNGVVGADEPATFSITSSPENVTIFDGTPAQLTLLRDISPDATVVTYFQDDGDGTHGAGDTDFFQLTLSGGNYTFDVLQDPPPATLDFNFDQLASGANLFGVVGTTSTALVVIGEDITLDANGKYITNQTDDIKTSQGGQGATIGVDSQMFDPGEGAFFTYVTNTSVLGGGDNANSIHYGDTFEVTSASFRISQTQGNDTATAQISAYDLDDAPQAVDFVNARGTGDLDNDLVSITAIRVFDAAGTLIEEETDDGSPPSVDDPTVDIVFSGPATARIATVSGLDDLYKIEWDTSAVHDQVLIKGVAGKFDIGEFAISQSQPTPDEKLDFTAQIADFDGDIASASFSVGIDGTGDFDDNQVLGVNPIP